jgi:hypothetical protein
MNRQQALNKIWRRLLIIFCALGAATIALTTALGYLPDDPVSTPIKSLRVPLLVFLCGNIGGYVAIHRSLSELKDTEIIGLADSPLGIVLSSFVGGILAFVLYVLFLSDIISGSFFPVFVPDDVQSIPDNIEKLGYQHAAEVRDYAKLFFWSFVAGFNQEYVVKIIESVKAKL